MAKRNFSVKKGSGSGGGGVTSFNSRTGGVMPQSGDYDFIELGDVPSAYTSAGGYFPQVNAALNGLIFVDIGLSGAIEVAAVATSALPAETYANGAAGVGATLTANANGAMGTVDSQAAALNKRYLIMYYTGANRFKNGVYQLSTVGTAGTQRVLTRTTDSDAPLEFTAADGTQQIVFAAYVGGNNSRKYYTQGQNVTTVGTSFITYVVNRAGVAPYGLAAVLGVSNDAGGLDITNLDDLGAVTVNASTSVTTPSVVITNDGNISDAGGTLSITFDDTGNSLDLAAGTQCSISVPGASFIAAGTSANISATNVNFQATGDINVISGVDFDASLLTGDVLFPDLTVDFGIGIIPVVNDTIVLGDSTHAFADLFASKITIGSDTYYSLAVALTAAQIKTGSSVPIVVPITPAAGKAIQSIGASVLFTAGATPFTNTTLTLIIDTATGHQGVTGTILTSITNTSSEFIKAGGATVASLIGNKSLTIKTNADSAVGDGTGMVYIFAKLITL